MSNRVKDVQVTIRLHNNQLLSRRRASGLTAIQVGDAAGVTRPTYGGLETMRVSPVRTLPDRRCRAPGCPKNYSPTYSYTFCTAHFYAPKKEQAAWAAAYVPVEITAWTKAADALAVFYCCTPEELFPEALRAIKKATIVSEMDVPELMKVAAITSGEPRAAEMIDGVEDRETRDTIYAALRELPPRLETIMLNRFGLKGARVEEDGETLDAIGETLDISKERTRTLERVALRQLSRHKRLCEVAGPEKRRWPKRL